MNLRLKALIRIIRLKKIPDRLFLCASVSNPTSQKTVSEEIIIIMPKNKSMSDLYKETMGVIPQEFQPGILFLTLHGSRAYGTFDENSDYDIRGVCIPPKKYYTGYLHSFEHLERKEPNDLALYELTKFCKMASEGNPNILELFYIPKTKWLYATETWKRFVENRHLFISKKCKFTFSGYAVSQLKRMKNHYNWLNMEEPKRPTRNQFNLPNQMKMTVSEEQVVYKLLQNEVLPNPEIVRDYITREQRYREAYDKWDTYTIWKEHRNPKRAELERLCGFDGKHGLHLVRLMKMCKEILTTGEVIVERPDATELLDVKNGKFKYEELISWAEEMDLSLEELYRNSTLQKEPNRNAIDVLCQESIEASILKEIKS